MLELEEKSVGQSSKFSKTTSSSKTTVHIIFVKSVRLGIGICLKLASASDGSSKTNITEVQKCRRLLRSRRQAEANYKSSKQLVGLSQRLIQLFIREKETAITQFRIVVLEEKIFHSSLTPPSHD
jgi:hypothetical protein